VGALRADRPLVAGAHTLRLAKVTTVPGLAGVRLQLGSRERLIPVESARRFKLAGYISRQLEVGPHKVFLYVAEPEADLQIVDLDSFATLARVPLGRSQSVGGYRVAFLGRTRSPESGGLATAGIILDGAATTLPVEPASTISWDQVIAIAHAIRATITDSEADIFEAVLGAIYLDAGLAAVRALLEREMPLDSGESEPAFVDAKTRLQERLQAAGQGTPQYRTVAASGPAHALEFSVEVRLGERLLGQGSGPSKRSAEQEAARRALEADPT
jgi:hypothetical protein